MVTIESDRACVRHAHAQKAGSKTDKPVGTVIKCYLFSTYGRKKAIEKAHALHYAIVMSERRAQKGK